MQVVCNYKFKSKEPAQSWQYQELLEWFLNVCWDLKPAAYAAGLFYKAIFETFGDAAISRISRDCLRSAVLTSSRRLTATKSAANSSPRPEGSHAEDSPHWTIGINDRYKVNSKPRPEDADANGNQEGIRLS